MAIIFAEKSILNKTINFMIKAKTEQKILQLIAE